MTAVAASSTAMTAVAASSTAMTAVIASSTAMTAVIASSTAMAAVANSKTALLAIWYSETALAAIRGSTSAVRSLVSSPYMVLISNTPSNLTSAMVTTKSILLQCKNSNGSDSDYLADKYSNGTLIGNTNYSTSTSYSTQVAAFSNIRHYQNSVNGYAWQAYIIDCD
jgi:hypothetical protein